MITLYCSSCFSLFLVARDCTTLWSNDHVFLFDLLWTLILNRDKNIYSQTYGIQSLRRTCMCGCEAVSSLRTSYQFQVCYIWHHCACVCKFGQTCETYRPADRNEHPWKKGSHLKSQPYHETYLISTLIFFLKYELNIWTQFLMNFSTAPQLPNL